MGSRPCNSNTRAKPVSATTSAPTKYSPSRTGRNCTTDRSSVLSCHSFFLFACISAIACSHLRLYASRRMLPPRHQQPDAVQARLFVGAECAHNAPTVHHYKPIAQAQQLVQVLGDQ